MIALALLLALGDDPITGKLNAAKSAHKAELDELKEPTQKWFAKQEAAVKRGGDKKAVKEVEDAMALFEKNTELPAGLPANLQKKYAAAATSLEKGFQAANKEYRQSKNMTKASEVDKEWLEFRIDGPGNAQPEIRDGAVCLFVARCSKMALTVDSTDMPGAAFVVQRPVDDADEQQHWIVHRRGTGAKAALAFQHRKYGLFMNVLGGSRGNGAEMIMHSKDGRGGNEQWFPARRGNWLTLTGLESRLLLAVPAGNQNAGSRIIQWQASNDDDQRFKLLPLRTSPK